MIYAFPTFKLYLIEEDESVSDALLAYDDFYYYNSVIGFNIHNSRELAAQTATIQLQNISGTLDGTKKGELRDIDIDVDSRTRPYATDDTIMIDSVVLRPGVNIQLRAGYGAHSKDLTVLMNGKLTEIKYSSDNMMCTITVQSFGFELETVLKNDYAKGKNSVFDTTGEVLASLAYSEELRHFGRIKLGRIFPVGQVRDNLVLDLEDTSEDTSYMFALGGGMLDFIERNKYAFTLGWIALELVGPFASMAKVALTARAATRLQTGTQLVTGINGAPAQMVPVFGGALANPKTAAWMGYAATAKASVKKVLERTTTLLGSNRFSEAIFLTPFTWGKRAYDFTTRSPALSELRRSVTAGVPFQNLSRYQQGRALGHGVISSLFRKHSIYMTTVQTETMSLRLLAQTQGYAAALGAAGAPTGNIIAKAGRLLELSRNQGRLGLFYNPFDMISKAAGIAAFSVLPVLYAGMMGGIGDLFAMMLSDDDDKEFQRRKNKLKKRIILSPLDDNLFPPSLESYTHGAAETKELAKAWKKLKKYGGSFGSDLAVGSYFFSPDGSNINLKKLLSGRAKLASKTMARGRESQYVLNNQTIWATLHDLTLRHPGYVYGIRPYGENFEYRIFFGRPNQKYFANGTNNLEAKRINTLRRILNKGELNKNDVWELYPKEASKAFGINPKAKTTEFTEAAYSELLMKENARFKPFRQFHLIESHRNLIKNDIVISGHNVINTVKVHYDHYDADGKERINASGAEDVRTIKLKASTSIPVHLERPKTIKNPNIKGLGAANRYGLGELLYGMKEMYTGSLLVLGNPDINPWDLLTLDDRVTNMYGPLEVKAVTHSFTHETGFLTDIEVNAVVSSNDYFTLPMVQQSIIYEARKDIFEDHTSRKSFGLTGDVGKDKTALKVQLNKTIQDMAEDTTFGSTFVNMLASATNPGLAAVRAANYLASDGPEIDPKLMNRLVDKLYDSYKNPNSINFLDDVKTDIGAPDIAGDLGNTAIRTLAAGMGTVSVTMGARRAYEYARYGSTRPGGWRLAAFSALALGLFELASRTDVVKNLTNAGVKHYHDQYLKDNIVKPFVLAKANEESVLKIMPLIKDGKPLLIGGLEAVSEHEKWNHVLGNHYNNMSDAYQGFMKGKAEMHARGASIIEDSFKKRFSFVKRVKIDLVETVADVAGIDENVAVGYWYGDETDDR